MDGQQLDQCFGSGFSKVKAVKVTFQTLSVPTSPINDGAAHVSEQQHRAEAVFDGTTGTLKITKDPNGEGLWIPWLGQGTNQNGLKGVGTYTQEVTNASWVATGPFSGCYAVAYWGGGGMRFAHIVTPGSGYQTASVDEQINAIAGATGAAKSEKYSMNGNGEGIAFFLKIGSAWRRRFVWVAPGSGMVMQMNAKSTLIT
jgi:hypothetical protein